MDGATSYEADVFAWAAEQGRVLRALAARRDLPNALDLPNIAEEIESLGRSELRAAESFVRLILSHLAKALSEPDSLAVGHWRVETSTWHDELLGALTPAMRPHVRLDVLWQRALRDARVALEEGGGALAAWVPRVVPVSLDDLTDPAFDLRALLARLRPD